MKKLVKDMLHQETNGALIDFLDAIGDVKINLKLDEALADRGLSQKQFSELTGIRRATISELCNLKRVQINIGQLVIIMLLLQITNINDLLEVEIPTDKIPLLDEYRKDWLENKQVPTPLYGLIFNNLINK